MMPLTSGGVLVHEPPEANCHSTPLELACPDSWRTCSAKSSFSFTRATTSSLRAAKAWAADISSSPCAFFGSAISSFTAGTFWATTSLTLFQASGFPSPSCGVLAELSLGLLQTCGVRFKFITAANTMC